MKKILDRTIDVLTFVILAISLTVMTLSLTQSEEGLSNIFGMTFLTVQSDSMEPTFYEDDLLISKIPQEGQQFNEGDVVTYAIVVKNHYILNTHRIVEVRDVGDVTYYVTKGDNETSTDTVILQQDDILAVWTSKKIGGVGKVVDYLQTKSGFFVCILVPMIIFFLYALFRFIKNTVDYNKENAEKAAKEAMNEFTEEQKQKVIQEYLEKQNKDQK